MGALIVEHSGCNTRRGRPVVSGARIAETVRLYMNGKWRIGMFGGLRLEEGGAGENAAGDLSTASAVTRFRTQKTASLLAYLAFYLQRDHPREELADRFWPDDDIESARGSLRVSLASLRRQLEPPPLPPGSVLAGAGRASVRLRPDAVVVDVAEFEGALARAHDAYQRADERAAIHGYRDALRWYRGPLLPGVYDDWVLTERDRLHERHVQALARVSELAEAAGDTGEATEAARRLVGAESFSESAHLRLVRLLAHAGRVGDAAHAFGEMADLLERERGEKPSPEAVALFARLRLDIAQPKRDAKASPPIKAQPASPLTVSPAIGANGNEELSAPDGVGKSSLPLFLSRFFGREDELICLYGFLSDPRVRLTTIQGPGGAGKTRLAVEAARAVQQHKGRMRSFAGGAWFVPLATVTDGARLFEIIRASLGLSSQGDTDPLAQIVAHLAGKRTLFLLDNMEQITGEAAPLVERLLNRLPDAVVLVTSRRRLGIAGERVAPVGPLELPEPGDDSADALAAVPSVGLFVDRAQTVSPGFGLTPRNAPVIAALCRRLEGLPLALELAAAWINVLSPQQLLTRMERRFALLQARPRDRREPRHQSLWAAIADSYDLLPPDLKRVFVALSAFRGGWTSDAAAAICGDPSIHDSLGRLRERSLITATTDSDAYRFTLLEAIREFAEEQLSDEEARTLARRHADYFAAWRSETTDHNEIAAEQDNLRQTLATFEAASDGLKPALGLAGGLWQFWWEKGQWQEGADALARLLARTEADELKIDPKTLARAWNGRGGIAFYRGDYPVALDAFQRSLAFEERIGVAKDIASLCNNVGAVNRIMGDFDGARQQGERSLALRRTIGEPHYVADSLTNLAGLALMVGDIERAEAQFNEACELYPGTPKAELGTALCLHGLAEAAWSRGDVARTQTLILDALARFRQAGQVMRIAHALTALAYTYQAENRLSDALLSHRECLPLMREMEDRQGGVSELESVADWAIRSGDAKGAARLLGASDALSFGYHRMKHGERERDNLVASVRAKTDEKTYARLFHEGEALSLVEALEAAERLLPPP